MAAWRRRAIEVSRHFARDFSNAYYLTPFSIYGVFSDLIQMVRDAHDANDAVTLRKIYGFAEWCLRRKETEFGNAAGVAFYEHLFDYREPEDLERIVPWLSPRMLADCWWLWEARSPRFVDIEALRVAIANRSETYYDDWTKAHEES